MIHHLPNLEHRFPELLERLHGIDNEARHDMMLLEVLSPQGFSFVKHFLALRVIMVMKIAKIESFIEEGFLALAYGQGLLDSIQERLHEIEEFTPWINPRINLNNSAKRLIRCSSGSWKKMSETSVHSIMGNRSTSVHS